MGYLLSVFIEISTMIVQKAKRKQYDDIGNTINRMDEAFLRFPHLPEQIMEKLDFKSLANSRVVAKSWKQFIDEREHRLYPFFKDEIADVLTYLHLTYKVKKKYV